MYYVCGFLYDYSYVNALSLGLIALCLFALSRSINDMFARFSVGLIKLCVCGFL